MRRITILLLVILALAAGGCTSNGADGEVTPEETNSAAETADELPDNCSLITAAEATGLAGYDLEVGEDSILGCGYLPPGSDVADVVVNAVRLEGDAASVAAAGFPNAAEIIPVAVGEDTVAVTTPSGDTVASIITASAGDFIELAIVFLGINPDDTAGIEAAAELAVTALGRWGDG
jgi:hypothetical protein